MCGITGFNWNDKELVKVMTNSIKHRGPDGFGYYTDKNVSLGHRRLAIIDLSKNGKQPMSDDTGTIWITFNGEIYNYKELRKELEKKYNFKSETDTETIIYAYKEYGIECLKKLNGMFAFAIWDSNKKILFLARDQIGVKPIYYYWDNKKFIFASEIKAILKHKSYKKELNKNSLSQLLRFGYVPFNNTLFNDIYKLRAGNYIILKDNHLNINSYYDIHENIIKRKEYDLLKELKEEINHSVKGNLESDVPIGVFLSGGIDSSLLTALAHKQNKNITAFTLEFDMFSEMKYAKILTKKLGIKHYTSFMNEEMALKSLKEIEKNSDEPIIDSGIIPVYNLSKLARKNNYKVVLSGDGSDEIFGGYDYYYKLNKLAKLSNAIKLLKPLTLLSQNINNKYKNYSELKDPSKAYLFINRMFNDNEIKLGTKLYFNNELVYSNLTKELDNKFNNYLNKILYLDLKYRLPEYFLMKTDKASMLNSIEVRVPYINNKIIDYSFTIQPELKFKLAKNALRKISYDLLPEIIRNRKKQGYGTPINSWIKNKLGEQIKNELDSSLMIEDHVFNKNFVEQTINKISLNNHYSNINWMMYSISKWYSTNF